MKIWERPTRRPWAKWSVVIAANGALLLVVGVSTVRETYREWRVDQEINEMQAQIESLEGRKVALSDLVRRMESEEALDREARTRLGLRKPGERVIILRGGSADSWTETSVAPSPSIAQTRSNPELWLRHFFPLPN